MTTRAWLFGLLMFSLGWMMHDASRYLQMVLQDFSYWMSSGTWGPPC